jgi:CRP-like cAMP-binding protein
MDGATKQEALRARVAGSPLFAGLPDDVATLLLSNATTRQATARAVIFHQGDAPTHLLQVVSGFVRMTQVNPDGTPTTLRIMRPGELLGCVAAVQQFAYPATATAMHDSTLLAWRSNQLLALMNAHPAIMRNVLHIVGARTKDMVHRVFELSGKCVEQRVAAALLRLAQQAGAETDDGIRIEFPVTREDLATMAGLTYFTISRTLSGWQRKGFVKNGRQRMTILDAVRLGEVADGKAR